MVQSQVQAETFHWLSSILIPLSLNALKHTHPPKTNLKD